MNPLLFWIFSLLMLGFGIAVIVNRSPVASALSLVVAFLCLAALYVGLEAYFLGAVQVVVYAGAVMVLFLFIIMLLDLRAEQRRKFNKIGVIAGALVAFAFMLQLIGVIHGFPLGQRTFPELKAIAPGEQLSDLQHVGRTLFTDYTLPFQVVGVLILVATISVIVISKRELK
jgi:NADH-quinone oxidoreductase subunit J